MVDPEQLSFDPGLCCGRLIPKGEPIYYCFPTGHYKYSGKTILMDDEDIAARYRVCGEASHKVVSVCGACVVRLGLVW